MTFMELRHLRYFIAVASNLNFSEASRRLHVAQPAISQTILDLENELGVKLLLRTSRSVELTAAGKAFFAEAQGVMLHADGASKAAQRASRGEIGCLRIGFLPCAAGPFIPALIKAYRKEFPKVEVRLHDMNTEHQLKAFDDGTIDVGFSRPFPKSAPKNLAVRLCTKIGSKLCCLPATRWRRKAWSISRMFLVKLLWNIIGVEHPHCLAK